ncbi:Na+/H+ antiporter subunit A [Actinomadura parmotrematis]|uniref:Na+/H+ antiporter subunit A n=1 Tax=Actinomadura parmotrematis TaxID=2864039 RepID=A0ABS7FN21_9ACTN|nr:Na+/H+ antiporter subunit A [Actinomadura parmotrematis]MBW8480987.1 Na+/H+ antiporter subunit A [Actinomadura parmotrematis]
MLLLIALHCGAAVLAPWLVGRAGRRAFGALALVPAAAALWAVPPWFSGAAPRTEGFAWMPGLHVEVALRADALGWMMTVVVGGVGALIIAYCARYFDDGDPRLGGLACQLLLFAAAMLGLVWSDDLMMLYVFWELTTVLSYLMVGFDAGKRQARWAATQAIVVTTFGGLAMLVGLVMLQQAAGTSRLSELLARPPHGTAAGVALALVLTGALSKSAILPFGVWLPGAMAAPTPVSAFLHAAAMVKAGVYLVLRFTPAFADAPVWKPAVVGLGGATMILAGWRALRETDLKRVLAYGTVSQLGFMMVLAGAGGRTAALAGVTLLFAHALFKAALFMVVGLIDHGAGTRDLRDLTGVARSSPALCAVACVAAASMAGLPTTLGFAGKEAAYEAFLHGDPVVLATVVLGSAFTAAYSLRYLWGAFANRPGGTATLDHPPGALALAAPAALAAAGVLTGLLVGPMDAAIAREVAAYPETGGGYHLSAWHGFGLALLLTAASLTLGAALFLARRSVARLERLTLFEPAAVYRSVMDALNDAAVQVTGAVQRGSLPGYLGIIALAAAAMTGTGLALATPVGGPDTWRLWDGPAQGVTALLTVLAALAAVRARNRAQTVVLSGASGYGVATLFVLQGAPDIALTQFLVESTSVIVFVLVLRTLPVGFPPTRPPARRVLHVTIGALAGVTATAATLLAAHARQAAPISGGYAAATRETGATNIVATTLVDLRAWDTLGESSVIALAALGVTSLVFARRRARVPQRAEAGAGATVWSVSGLADVDAAAPPDGAGRRERTWLAAGPTLAAERRSIIFEVVARLIFHTVLLLSLYLLFTAHSAPGGGFAGGIVAGLALVIRYLAGGPFELAEAAPVNVGTLLGLGLVVSTGTAFGGLVWGDAVLQSAVWEPHPPLLGAIHFNTALLFDIGVYLIVVGLVLDVLTALGAEADRQTGTGAAA